jgi:hypothetical protein
MYHRIRRLKIHHQVIFAIIIAFAVVSFWRGVWGLMDEYLFPYNVQMSYWASLLLGLLILIICDYATRELM